MFFFLVDGIWLSILGTAESSITIMAASIPILRALFRHIAVASLPPPQASFCNSESLGLELSPSLSRTGDANADADWTMQPESRTRTRTRTAFGPSSEKNSDIV